MRYRFRKTIVIALGGSVVFPEGIDVPLLKKLRTCFKRWSKHKRFVVVVGGGRLSRIFTEAASKIVHVADEDKDWLGIHATRLNAHLIRTIFRDVADPVLIDERHTITKLTHPLTIGAGWKPGWSTDYIAVRLAADFSAREVVVVGKPNHVYDRDPKHKSAKPLRNLTWGEYQKLIPKKWTPGAHAPVDPVAARLAEREGIRAIVVGGKDLKNLECLLKGSDFRGTVIQ